LAKAFASTYAKKRTIFGNSGAEIWCSITYDFAAIWQFRQLARQISVTDTGKLQICFCGTARGNYSICSAAAAAGKG
jgi:hypothetical protein